jgi:hypothetical protein
MDYQERFAVAFTCLQDAIALGGGEKLGRGFRSSGFPDLIRVKPFPMLFSCAVQNNPFKQTR